MARLDDAAGRVVVVVAAGGYGKTSHLRAWADGDGRPAAWITLTAAESDPARLLSVLGRSIAQVTDLDAGALPSCRGASAVKVSSVVAPALGRLTAECATPFVLVLDDTHLLDTGPAWDLLDAIATNVPAASTVVFAGRAEPLLSLGRLRLTPGVTTIDEALLALDVDAADVVLREMGLDLDAPEVARLVERTEGWPVGLRLVGQAVLDHGRSASEVLAETGCDTYVAEYLHDEWLGRLPSDDALLLQQMSCFDELTAELCDAVLERSDSGRKLDELQRSALLVIPLDRRGSSYRLHHLLVDLRQRELRRTDPDTLRRVHARGSVWFEQEGDLEGSFGHALAAGDLDRAEDLAVRYAGVLQSNGRHATLLRWLESLPVERVHSSAALCVTGALALIGIGDAAGAIRWLRAAEHALSCRPSPDPQVRFHVATARALIEPPSIGAHLVDVEEAYRHLAPGPWRGAACLACGALRFMNGDDAPAIAAFRDGVAEATACGLPTVEALNRAYLAVVHFEQGAWAKGCVEAAAARTVLRVRGLEDVPSTMLVAAAASIADAQEGRPEAARAEIQRARRHLAFYDAGSPSLSIQTRIALAGACLQLGDRVGASTLLAELEWQPPLELDSVRPKQQIADLVVALDRARRVTLVGPSALTTAEMRVLQFLPTNLSLVAIADRLFVSRNTVKAHTVSIYRKLGVNSRAEAVDRAIEAALIAPR